MTIKSFFEKLASSWFVWPSVCLVCAVGVVVSVIADYEGLEVFCGLTCLFTLAMTFLCAIVAFVLRKTLIGVASLILGIVMLAAAFLAIIIAAVGQHHPPQRTEEEMLDALDWGFFFWEDTENNRMLGADIPKGSWWTDGQWFYEVTESGGGKVLMQGYTLHEGGGLCAFEVSDTLIRTIMPTEGYTTFAEAGRLVTHQELIADSGRVHMEVLIAYAEDERTPVAFLQRLDDGKPIKGDAFEVMEKRELAYELGGIYVTLADAYADSLRTWTFRPDGTVRTSPEGEFQPYEVCLAYGMPSNVVQMPNGEHYALMVRRTSLYVSKAVYDQDDEFWMEDTSEKMYVYHLENDDNDKKPLWSYTRLLTPPMLNMMEDDLPYVAYQLYDELAQDNDPVRLLNHYLLRNEAEKAKKEKNDETED